MLTGLAAKVAVTIVLGFSAGFFGGATEALGSTPPPQYGGGAFGGPITHVGGIEWDVSQPMAPALRRVRCANAAPGTSCDVSRY